MPTLAEVHRQLYREFVRDERATGGPDPHLYLNAEAIRRQRNWISDTGCAIRAGLYVIPYTCAGAALLWYTWEQRMDDAQIVDFLNADPQAFPTRRERRVIWGADRKKLLASMHSWVEWCRTELPTAWQLPYPELHANINQNVMYFGRYASMKVIEVLFNAGLVQYGQSDMRPRGGKYPRRTLSWMFPEDAHLLASKSDRPEVLERCNQRFTQVRADVGQFLGTELSPCHTETLLCNYRTSLEGRYPGISHDRELTYWNRAAVHFPEEVLATFPFYQLRAEMFPHQFLGERGNPPWSGKRPFLMDTQQKRSQDRLKEATDYAVAN